jgi:hypothetical protein
MAVGAVGGKAVLCGIKEKRAERKAQYSVNRSAGGGAGLGLSGKG